MTVQEESRRSYHVHYLTSTTTLIVLDSNVAVRHQDQVAWLQAQLVAAPGRSRWALYHAPLYPSIQPLSTAQSALGRQHWGPVFDSMGLQIGFENHEHGMKRTHPIVASQRAAAGPVYVGDGCWGVEAVKPRADLEPDVFSFTAHSQHIILGQRNAAGTGWELRMVDPLGTVLHRFEVDG